MPKFNTSKNLPYQAKDLFDLVLDIESYPEFLPWCNGARIISKNDDQITAELQIKYKYLSFDYISNVKYHELDGNYEIHVQSKSYLFKYLKNSWQIKQMNEFSSINFDIDFDVKSKMLSKLIKIFFSYVADTMINSFEKRAKQLFGKVDKD
ncbi:MAG: type II toxin-antitoxin system RatA family toxin [Rickettsiaceae bacterium]